MRLRAPRHADRPIGQPSVATVLPVASILVRRAVLGRVAERKLSYFVILTLFVPVKPSVYIFEYLTALFAPGRRSQQNTDSLVSDNEAPAFGRENVQSAAEWPRWLERSLGPGNAARAPPISCNRLLATRGAGDCKCRGTFCGTCRD